MNQLELRIGGIENAILQLISMIEKLNLNNNEQNTKQKYYSLKDAAKLKYGDSVSYQTIQTNYLLQPCCGVAETISAGKKLWTYEQLEEYMHIQDKDIPVYAAKYGVPLVGRLGAKYKKYL